ncbi:uncharacterized protein [Onthophagus taurus]|uniref:uncharacterized protein isoform X3 n=1 Tax=Onthophagus taurus TaxID=166361 RepID=UPI0039BE3D9C
MESHELDHGTIAGILKTIFLFLEGQNLNKTCETFLLETEQLGYPPIRTAIAQILILKPAVTETVTVTRAPADVDLICHCDEETESDQKDTQINFINETNDQNEEQNHDKNEEQNHDKNEEQNHDKNEEQNYNENDKKESENKLAMAKPSVTFSSEKNPYQNPPKEDERNQKNEHQQKDNKQDPKSNQNMLLKDRVINAVDSKETEMKSISDIIFIENSIDCDIDEEIEFIPELKGKTPKSENVDSDTFNFRKFQKEINQVASDKYDNASQKDESLQINSIDFGEISEKSKINGVQIDASVGTNNPEEFPLQHIHFDYKRIKYDLKTHNDEFKLMVLQAVRWQITKTSPEDRNKTIVNLAKSDLLGLHGNLNINEGKDNELSLVKLYLLSENSPNLLQEGIARLLNAISSCTLGRDYLCQDDRTIRFSIIPLVCGRNSQTNSIGISETTKEHLLVTLQKLSLRSKMRLVMIESGLPEYLVEFLSNKHDALSDYCLEYCCALFMNLCLHKETHFGMKNISNYLLDMLIKILTNHEHCIPYLNGAMYSLFNDEALKEQAKKSHLHAVLLDQIKHFSNNCDIQQQLELIVKEIEGKLVVMAGACDIDCQIHEDVEIDYIEPEIDIDDPLSENVNGTDLRAYEKQRGQPEASSFACLCQPVMPFKKITIKSFCTAQEDDDLSGYIGESLDAILSTVAEIDKEIAANSTKNVILKDSHEQTDQKELKNQNVSARVESANKSTQNKKDKYRDRYDPSPPIIYDPIHCACVNKRDCLKQKRRGSSLKTEKLPGNKTYNCNCISQMQKFVENHCGNCDCPANCKTVKRNSQQSHPKTIYQSDY